DTKAKCVIFFSQAEAGIRCRTVTGVQTCAPPISIFHVDRIRDGRSFAPRRVTAIQEGEAIFSMSASFHLRDQEGIEHQDPMPPVIDPEEIPAPQVEDLDDAHKIFAEEWQQWDIRIVPRDRLETSRALASQQRVWFRSVE